MIAGQFLTRLAKFRGFVSVNDFLVSSSAPGNSPSSFGSPGKFLICTGRTATTKLLNLVPPRHLDDCHAIHFLYREICDPLLSSRQIYRFGHDCTSTSSARRPRYFRLQEDIAFRVLRKVRVDTMLTRTRFHCCSRLYWQFMRRTGSVSMSKIRVSP